MLKSLIILSHLLHFKSLFSASKKEAVLNYNVNEWNEMNEISIMLRPWARSCNPLAFKIALVLQLNFLPRNPKKEGTRWDWTSVFHEVTCIIQWVKPNFKFWTGIFESTDNHNNAIVVHDSRDQRLSALPSTQQKTLN